MKSCLFLRWFRIQFSLSWGNRSWKLVLKTSRSRRNQDPQWWKFPSSIWSDNGDCRAIGWRWGGIWVSWRCYWIFGWKSLATPVVWVCWRGRSTVPKLSGQEGAAWRWRLRIHSFCLDIVAKNRNCQRFWWYEVVVYLCRYLEFSNPIYQAP